LPRLAIRAQKFNMLDGYPWRITPLLLLLLLLIIIITITIGLHG
jgi:hypothetical protein